MRRKAWYRAVREFSGRAWTFPSRTDPKRSVRAGRVWCSYRRSFDVLYLLAQFFDLRFDFERQAGNGQRFAFDTGRLGKHGVGLAMHFLQQEVEFFSEFSGTLEQFGELLQMAAQAI